MRPNRMTCRWTLLALALASPLLWSGETYPSMRAAMGDAVKFLEKRDYKSAQRPLEAALKLADNDDDRLRIYNNLMACYRQLPENDKMIEACEFTIAKTKLDAERSITAGSLTSFMFQRGKLDETRTRYETRLAQSPDDLVSLAMMAAICKVNFKDQNKAADYKDRLNAVERQRAGQLAEDEEKLAGTDKRQPETAHWKQAAVYWIRAGAIDKALAAARKAESTGPEKRSEQLLHYWHRQLGEVYLAANAHADAVRHLTHAIETTKIAGYKQDCEKLLADAKAKIPADKN